MKDLNKVEKMTEFYKVLEISRTATEAEIKKSYKKLALRWHPDKNPENLDEANRKFREISEAYEVLIDDKKRKIYDQYGREGLIGHNNDGFNYGRHNNRRQHTGMDSDFIFNGFPFVFRDPNDVFREFFGGSPFDDVFFNPGLNRRHHHGGSHSRHRASHPQNIMSPFLSFQLTDDMFAPHMGLNPFGGMPGNGNITSISSFGGSSRGGASNVRQINTSTLFVNGVKKTTKKVLENGVETITSYENDVLKSKTVNGVAQAISYN